MILYVLITIITQTGTREIFIDEYNTKKECLVAKTEASFHNNELTKVTAYCLKSEVK